MKPILAVSAWVLFAAIVHSGASNARADGPVAETPKPMPILQLTAQDPWFSDQQVKYAGNLWLREMQRQAVLIAAREELGLRTRDMALGEPFTEHGKDGVTTLLMETRVWRGSNAQSWLARFDGDQPTDPYALADSRVDVGENKVVGLTDVKLSPNWFIDYDQFAAIAEQQSRGEYVDILKKAGILGDIKPIPTPWVDAGPADPATLSLLAQMSPFAQFAAARLLHAQMRSSGASFERTQALVMAYANLGFLTHTQWSGMFKSYLARSLLYAERLEVHEQGSARSLYTRAYARAMCGLQRLALEDLAAADKLDSTHAPPWREILDAYCHDDLPRVRQAKVDAELKPLAGLLEFEIAFDGYSPERFTGEGLAYLKRNADCLVVLQQLAEGESLGLSRMAPLAEIAAFPASLNKNLAALTLPVNVESLRGQLIDSDGGELDKVAVLRTALAQESIRGADQGEPSLGALSSLVRDEAFTAAAEHAMFLKFDLGMDIQTVKTFVEEAKSTWQDHPLRPYMESMELDPSADYAAYRDTFKSLKVRDGGPWMIEGLLMGVSPEIYVAHRQDMTWPATTHTDMISLDYSVVFTGHMQYDSLWDDLKAAVRESPNSAKLYRCWMDAFPRQVRREDIPMMDAVIAEARAKFPGRMRVDRVAAEWALDANDGRTAVEMLESVQKDDPSITTDTSLAAAYIFTSQIQKAMQAVDHALSLPDSSLMSNVLASDMAQRLTAEGRFPEALTYAKAAAGAGSASGLVIYAQCLANAGQTQETRDILRSAPDRYSNMVMIWYAWAKGAGDSSLGDARDAAQAYVQSHPDDVDFDAAFWMIENKPAEEVKIYQAHEKLIGGSFACVEYAIAAIRSGDAALAAHVFEGLQSPIGEIDVLRLFSAVYFSKDLRHDLDAYDASIKAQWNLSSSVQFDSRMGRLLEAMGHKPEALKYLSRCIRTNMNGDMAYAAACDALRRLGEDPVKLAAVKEPLPPFDPATLVGRWHVTIKDYSTVWTFAADGGITSTGGPPRGRWYYEGNRIFIVWTPKMWDVFELPAKETKLDGYNWTSPEGLHAEKIP